MQADDELCLCFHITCRKVLNYIRIHQVRIPSQLAHCGGAGTGCGWCRKQLEKLMILSVQNPPSASDIEQWLTANTPDRQKYAEARARYRASRNQGESTLSGSEQADQASQAPGEEFE
ncbi:MAG: bacterioferritin-associated ferredoxin [Planctomycetota bacterium]|jgi:bacterioferritin-associated ferredoxin